MLFRCDARSLRLLVRCVSARATTAAVEEVQEMPLDVAAVPAPATQAAAVPPLTVSTLLTSWTWDSAAVVLAVILSAAYVLAVRRVRARGLAWPVGRNVAFAAGVGSLLLVTLGGIGRYAHVLLWVYTIQVVVLLLVTPALLAFGRLVRAITSPLVGPIVVPVVLAAVYFTPVLRVSLQHPWAFGALHVGLILLGLLIAIGLVGDGVDRETSLALAIAVAVGLAEFLLDAVPGMVVRLRTHLLAPEYWGTLHRPWGPSPLTDQQHAGAVLWFVAEVADLPFLVILVLRWVRADAREAIHIDYQLDNPGLAASPQPAPSPAAAGSGELGPGLQRPWWETDPARLGGHRLAREYGARSDQHGADQHGADRPRPPDIDG